ncbi:MAG: maleylpyruvate isomerase N-terminal domain-containing protein [Acidimicrobiia bacterium]
METDVVVALDAELSAFVAALARVLDRDFARVTNCPPWTLKELVVHVDITTRLPVRWPRGSGIPKAASEYYRRVERASSAYGQQNVERAQLAAAECASGVEAVERLARTQFDVIDRLRGEDLDRVIDVPAVGPMLLRDYIATRVVGVAAHGLDVSITLTSPPSTTQSAAAVCRPILLDLLDADLPSSLRWTDDDLLACGTGRRPLRDPERAALGALHSRFPLIS